MTAATWLAGAALGGAGALLRHELDAAVQRRFAVEFPLGTLVVNLLGSLVLGLLTGLAVSGTGLLLAGTATLGSFTTFSTWLLESERLAEEGATRVALLNLGGSLVLGFVAAVAGWLVGRAL